MFVPKTESTEPLVAHQLQTASTAYMPLSIDILYINPEYVVCPNHCLPEGKRGDSGGAG
jgi:hypothetical protein